MLAIFAALIIGIFIGAFNLLPAKGFQIIDKLMGVILFLLIFTLAVGVGSDEMIFANLSSLGLKALLLSVGAIIGSILLLYMVKQKWFREER